VRSQGSCPTPTYRGAVLPVHGPAFPSHTSCRAAKCPLSFLVYCIMLIIIADYTDNSIAHWPWLCHLFLNFLSGQRPVFTSFPDSMRQKCKRLFGFIAVSSFIQFVDRSAIFPLWKTLWKVWKTRIPIHFS